MTDNEKRAHDIAVAAMIIAGKIPNKGTDTVDIYQYYISAYNAAIESVNRDFPDGK